MRFRQICILFILLYVTNDLAAQNGVPNGKYFYHHENDSVDSIYFFQIRSGDTITYWTGGASMACENKQVRKFEKKKGFGTTIQRGRTMEDGRVIIYLLSENKFLIRNDSLFEWNETYKISYDSIMKIKNAYDSAQSLKERTKYSDMIQDNTKHEFVFVFTPGMFKDNFQITIEDDNTLCYNKVTLLYKWVTNTNEYYKVEMSNECGIWGHRWNYILTKDFDFITFGGYASKEIVELSKAKLIEMHDE